MAENMRQRPKPASLAVQVMQAEWQVLHRRRLIGARASMLGQCIQTQLTSPTMLILACGLGFGAGHFSRCQASSPSNTEHPRGAHNKLFGRALKLIALARIVSRAFPSAAMDPPVQAGLPGQPPAPRFRPAAAS